MKRIRRMVTVSLLGALLALAMSGSPAPAQAAGVKLYVDDDPANNGPVSCPATGLHTLQDALAALGGATTNVSITVCPGFYVAATNQVVFNGFNGLKIMGKGGPLFSAIGFSGSLISVGNSTKVTISGLYISGGGDLGAGAGAALFVASSSALIRGNVITDWHQSFYAPLTQFQVSILVTTDDPSQKVTVDKNTVFDPQFYGILYTGVAKAKITKNRVVMHSDVSAPAYLTPGPEMRAGIVLLNAGAGSQVTANVVESNSGMEPYPCPGLCAIPTDSTRGIILLQTSGAKVTGNTVSHTKYGISVESWCYAAAGADTHADANTISGNKLYNNNRGVVVNAQDYAATTCVAHADNNIVKGNKFDHNSMAGGYGVLFNASLPETAAGNKTTGNTFTGFFTTPVDMTFSGGGTGVSGSVDSGNKVSNMPLVGPLK